jgi:hypothetical protein
MFGIAFIDAGGVIEKKATDHAGVQGYVGL